MSLEECPEIFFDIANGQAPKELMLMKYCGIKRDIKTVRFWHWILQPYYYRTDRPKVLSGSCPLGMSYHAHNKGCDNCVLHKYVECDIRPCQKVIDTVQYIDNSDYLAIRVLLVLILHLRLQRFISIIKLMDGESFDDANDITRN